MGQNLTKMDKKNFVSLALVLSLLIFPTSLFSLPEGEIVISGQAVFDRSAANNLQITTPSDRLIVNYDSFNIAQQEAVNFIQPSAGSVALNRVVGADPSSIFGSLTANGKIFLINPNGVMFGPGSRVDVPALVASTLDISNQDFLSGNYNFFKNGESAFLINQGNIVIKNGGYVCLLSQAVENQGIIQADLGTVALAAGEKMTLALDDLNNISVVVDEGVKQAVLGKDSAIKNTGTISANGGKVLLTAKVLNKVFDYALNNEGVIEANSLVNNKGVLELITSGAAIKNTGKITPFTSSDKFDYAPWEQPLISGSGFLPNTKITVNIISPDGTVTTLIALTDAKGEFSLNYTPYLLMSGSYLVTATDGIKNTITTFTDQLPFGSIVINSGATSTTDPNVTLTITGFKTNGPFIFAYRLADGTDASGGTIVLIPGAPVGMSVPYTTDVPWTLPLGDGEKTVALKFGLAGESSPITGPFNWRSENFTDTIILQTPVPLPTSLIYQQDQLRYKLPYLEQFAPGQVNPFDFITSSDLYGPVYFYHPLTESDSSAFAALAVGADAYKFINGIVNLVGHDGLLQYLNKGIKK